MTDATIHEEELAAMGVGRPGTSDPPEGMELPEHLQRVLPARLPDDVVSR